MNFKIRRKHTLNMSIIFKQNQKHIIQDVNGNIDLSIQILGQRINNILGQRINNIDTWTKK